MRWFQSLARKLLGEYWFFRIYSIEPELRSEPGPCNWQMGPIEDVEEVAGSDDPKMQECTYYVGEEAWGFGAWLDEELVGQCWFWAGQRYAKRNFWPLRSDEAKLVRVVTHERFRGRGIAPSLIAYASQEMRRQGFRRLFARVWHSYTPSRRAFEKSGWTYVALVLEVYPFGARKPLRLVHKKAL